MAQNNSMALSPKENIPRILMQSAGVMNHYTSKEFFTDYLKSKDADMAQRLTSFLSNGGKNIRPAYVLGTGMAYRQITMDDLKKFNAKYENVSVPIEKGITKILRYVPAAASIQFDHAWYLIHDDIEDNSLVRRGEWAYHVVHGLDNAINDGDYLDRMANKIMEKANDVFELSLYNKETKDRLVQTRGEMQQRTVEGQALELLKRSQGLNNFTIGDVENIMRNKTGYTTETPVKYGSIIAGKNDSFIERLYEPMMDATVGFQIIDDQNNLLMKRGDAKKKSDLKSHKVGKDYAGDLDEGKRSIQLAIAYERADSKEKEFLEKYMATGGPYGNIKTLEEELHRKLDPTDLNDRKLVFGLMAGKGEKKLPYEVKDKIIGMMHTYNVFKDSRDMAFDYVKRANEALVAILGKRAVPIIRINNFNVRRTF